MIVQFSPSQLSGTIAAVPSKSASHRALICAALAEGRSVIKNLIFSEDILATVDCLQELGAQITCEGSTAAVTGITPQSQNGRNVTLKCRESGSTLRFLIPVAAALGCTATYLGTGKLPTRPVTPYLEAFQEKGVAFSHTGSMPFTTSGSLQAGRFSLPGNVSSQFISGLLFALPLLQEDSVIEIAGSFESRPYVLMTLQMLQQFGISASLSGNVITIKGNQRYIPCELHVEGDFSQAAFFLAAGTLNGAVTVTGLDSHHSLQGDKAIIDLLQQCGANVKVEPDQVTVSPPAFGTLRSFSADARDIPDLVPVLAVLAGQCDGETVIHHAERLKIKESDRLQTTSELLTSLGGRVTIAEDGLRITGGSPYLSAVLQSYNDHRIAMSAAIAASVAAGPVTLTSAEAVKKSYPGFYCDYQFLGGNANVIDME